MDAAGRSAGDYLIRMAQARTTGDKCGLGLDMRDRHAAGQISDHGLAVARGRLANALAEAIFPPKSNEANDLL